jgi:hypothetical protein
MFSVLKTAFKVVAGENWIDIEIFKTAEVPSDSHHGIMVATMRNQEPFCSSYWKDHILEESINGRSL